MTNTLPLITFVVKKKEKWEPLKGVPSWMSDFIEVLRSFRLVLVK
jgi:hypothetical protein